MKLLALIAAALLLSACSNQPVQPPRANYPMCVYTQAPNAEYEVIRFFRVGKNSYGSVNDILPKFAQAARKLDADAVINFSGSQRFGFWPWRVVRPVAQGTAIKWKAGTTIDCQATGGRLF